MRIKIDDPPSGHAQLFDVGDILRCKVLTNEVPAILIDNWLLVAETLDPRTHGYPDADYWEYEATLESGTAGLLPAGAAIVNYGQAGDGYVKLTSDEGYAPFIDIATHAGSPWTTITTHCRLGNLDGIMGLGTGSGYSNLIVNPTFEIDISSWTVLGADATLSHSAAQYHYGSYSMLSHKNSLEYCGASQDVNSVTSASGEYVFSVWVYPTEDCSIYIGIYDLTGGDQLELLDALADRWTHLSVTKTYGGGEGRKVSVYSGNCTDFYIDDAHLRAGTGEWGLVVGTDLSDDTLPHVVVSNQQVGLWGVEQTWWDSAGNARGQVDPSAGDSDVLFWLGPSEAGAHFKVLGSGDVWLDTLAISGDLGDFLFSKSDGLLLLGPNCEINATEWWSLRRQKATIAGALHQEAGRWLGAQALMVEIGTTNIIPNPSWESAYVTNYNAAGTPSLSFVTTHSVFGTRSRRIQTDADDEGYGYAATAGTAAGSTYTWSAYLRGTGAVRLSLYDDVAGQQYGDSITLTGRWTRYSVTKTYGVGSTTRHANILQEGAGTADIYTDGWQLEGVSIATSYCDGSLGSGYTWSGTAHESTGTRTATSVTIPTADSIVATEGYVAMWFKVPVWNPSGGFLWCAGNVNTEFDALIDSSGTISLRMNTGAECASAAGAATVDVWHHVVFNWKTGTDESELFLDGVSIDTGTCGGATPTLHANLGIGYSPPLGTVYDLLGLVGEFATGKTMLTAAQVTSIYALQRPLVDAGTMDAPGIYILDGKFKMASSLTGAHIEVTSDYIAGYSDATTKQFYIQASDGKAVCGGGVLELDSSGITIAVASTAPASLNAYKFGYEGTIVAGLYGTRSADGDMFSTRLGQISSLDAGIGSEILVTAMGAASEEATIKLETSGWAPCSLGVYTLETDSHVAVSRALRVGEGLYVGATNVQPPDDCLVVDDYIRAIGGLHVGGAADPGTDNLVVDGSVGIGVAPSYKLDVLANISGNFAAHLFNDGDNVDRYVLSLQGGADDGAAVGNTMYVYALDGNAGLTGTIQTTNGVFALHDVSDESRKVNIANTKIIGLDVIKGLKVRDYNWKTNPKGPVMTSFVAQEAQEVYPAMIGKALDGTLTTTRTTLIPILTKAIQELDARLTRGGL